MRHEDDADAAQGSAAGRRSIARRVIAGGFVALLVAMLGMLALGVALLRG